jgi:hypothetical protein
MGLDLTMSKKSCNFAKKKEKILSLSYSSLFSRRRGA